MAMETKKPTGLMCLRVLLSQFRRGVNFAALMTDEIQQEYQTNDFETLFKLTEAQKLRSEKITDLEQIKNYNGPMLAKLQNGNWLLLVNTAQLNKDTLAVVNPAEAQKVVPFESARFKEEFSGEAIIFRNLAQVDASKQTKLTAFIAVAKHHTTQIDIREIMHEYAVGEEEVKERHLRHIAADYKFKSKEVKLSWKKLESVRKISKQ